MKPLALQIADLLETQNGRSKIDVWQTAAELRRLQYLNTALQAELDKYANIIQAWKDCQSMTGRARHEPRQ